MAPVVYAQLVDSSGENTGSLLQLPVDITPDQLNHLVNEILTNEEPLPYSFYVDEQELVGSIQTDVIEKMQKSPEEIITIKYSPQALFKVRTVTRCSSSMQGHTEAVVNIQFSPDGNNLASGSGDTTVRFWDLTTETPKFTGTSHKNWVVYIAWSPHAKVLASGSMDNGIQLWDGKTGKAMGGMLKGHTKYITCLSWEPFHRNEECNRLASSSKDGTIKLWDTVRRQCYMTLSQHTDSVSCVKWGGEGWIYSASRDRTIKVWDAEKGTLIKNLLGHAHWVNSLALSTDYVLRTGPFDHTGKKFTNVQEAKKAALERYETVRDPKHKEVLISGSDDYTMFMWTPHSSSKPVNRMTGHQGIVNHVSFSPDGRLIASASFDKSVKLWNGLNGK
jgi:ribosome assembly protein 4